MPIYKVYLGHSDPSMNGIVNVGHTSGLSVARVTRLTVPPKMAEYHVVVAPPQKRSSQHLSHNFSSYSMVATQYFLYYSVPSIKIQIQLP